MPHRNTAVPDAAEASEKQKPSQPQRNSRPLASLRLLRERCLAQEIGRRNPPGRIERRVLALLLKTPKLIRRRHFKAREPVIEHEMQHSGRPIPLLPDNQFRLIPIFLRRLLIEKIRPVDEQHHVRILLDGPRLAQIRQLRIALVFLRSARNWLNTSTGTFNSFAIAFKAREMLETSSLRFPNRPRAVTNCK